jgi:hypothetical protein
MADTKVFTEEQHVQLLESAIERETASLTAATQELTVKVETLTSEKAAVETENTELQNKLDVVESEKAAETARADAAEKALTDFQDEIAEKAAIQERKEERLAAVKAADENLDDEYFTDGRVQRWAEMSDDSFAALVEDLSEAAAKKKPAFLNKEDMKDGGADDSTEKSSRETAAFKGGEAPTAVSGGLRALLEATGKLPASV